ncbi:hypothetical protein [Deinococcus aquatilis]|uniref:hypothetical protein n=1 Tax=Deinococcus aquatilis TaxID=519440 RepID=UPI0003701C88|nr:hypothetical protein [Deinococcus aquatilis]
MKRPTGDAVGTSHRLAHLFHLAQQDAQRPGNAGGGMKIMEALLNLPNFRPTNGGKA